MKLGMVIVAAGSGARAKSATPKQYNDLCGKAVIAWSVQAAARSNMEAVVCVISAEHADLYREAFPDGRAPLSVLGGATRTQSVRAGLEALAPQAPDIVLIHDAARPGLTPELIERLVDAIEGGATGSAPALPMADALWTTDADNRARAVAPREGLRRVQTPQAFRYAAIRAAYAQTLADGVFDDDIAVAVAAGFEVRLVPGDPRLMKLTYPEDFRVLERMLNEQREVRVGTGFDAHRFAAGDHVTLCGVQIAHGKGLAGHSDADVGWHALVDALLGAVGAEDIGAHFPPGDARWAGADSALFLTRAAEIVAERGGRIVHVDVTLICERPKVAPHREAMRARTAEVLNLDIARVSIKATTTERMGFTGREEGLAAQAVATIERLL